MLCNLWSKFLHNTGESLQEEDWIRWPAWKGLCVYKNNQQGFMFAAKNDMETLWHVKMEYSSNQVLQHTSHLVNCNFDRTYYHDVYHKEKQCRTPFPLSVNKFEAPFELIHCNLWGNTTLPDTMDHITF